ncbi:MAG: hypothetical protein ACM3O3_06890 [Syntrophothermus sp.]
MKTKHILLIAVPVVLIIIFLLPIKIPFVIKAEGLVVPGKEWLLFKDPNGSFSSILKNNAKGISESYFTTTNERGDAFKFSFADKISDGCVVFKGDTIALIHSNEIERQLIGLRSELNTTLKSLNVVSTGEKAPIIEQAKNQLAFAKKQVEDYKKVYDRNKIQFEKNLIPVQDYETSLSTYQLYLLNVSIAEAQLNSLLTGAKKEELDLVKAQSEALKNEINVLEKRSASFEMISPINGIAKSEIESDTLIRITNLEDAVIIIPIKPEESVFVTENCGIKINGEKAEFLRTKNKSVIGSPAIYYVYVKVKQSSFLNNSLSAEAEINCESLSLFDYLVRKIKLLLS